MNAYELANELSEFMTEDEYTELDKTIFKAVTMLRQQADRIAELEKPHKYDPETGEPLIDGYPLFSGLPRPQTKPLSDEEITNVFVECLLPDGEFNEHEFARAIEERHGIK